MGHTRHIVTRMNQRGIGQDLIDLALHFGERQDEKHILNRKSLERLLAELRQLERTVIRALDKGGVVVVEELGQLITTYTAESYDRRRSRSYLRERRW